MMNSFALQNIINSTQGSGTASHPGRTLDGPGFLMFLAMEQLAAEQPSIPSDAFFPDSDGQIVKALGNGQRIDLAKAAIAPAEKDAELAHNKKAPYSILDGRIQHPASSIKHLASSIKYQASSIKYQASSIRHQVSRKLGLHRSDPRPRLRIRGPRLKTQDSSLSPVSRLKSPVSSLMSYIYPLADQVVKDDIISQATEDVHRLDISLMNAGADMRALRHTSYVMRNRHDIAQPSVVHVAASQSETIESVLRTPPPDQPFPQVKQTTDHRSSLMNAGADMRALRHTSHVMRNRHDVTQLSVALITSQPETIERVLQTSPPDQPFLRFEPMTQSQLTMDHQTRITDHELPITDHRYAIVLPKAPAEKQIFYANPKLVGSVEGKNPGVVITSVKHGSGYTEENPEASLHVKDISEVYRQPETEHAPRADASQVKPSIQVQKVTYVSSGDGELEQREIGEMGERPVISDATYPRSGSPADEVIKTPVSEDNHGSSEPQLKMATGDYRPTHQIEAPIDERQISQHVFKEQGSPELSLQDNSVRFNTLSSSAFEETSVAEKVQAPQQREIIPQTPREYVRIEDNIQEIQPEPAGEKNVDRIEQPLRQEINPQDIQGYVKHPQLNDEVRSETQYAAASLDAFEGTSVDGRLQESHSQEIIPEIPQKPVRIEGNVQEIQPDPVADEKVDRMHQPLRQEIRTQNVQEYSKHPEPNDDVKAETRYEAAPLNAFEGASVGEKVQRSQPQVTIPQTPREYVQKEDNAQEVQPEMVAEEKVDRIHQPLPQDTSPQDLQRYDNHPEFNDDAKIEMRYEAAPLNTFEGVSVAEKVQKSQPQVIIPQTPREYVRVESNIQEIQPELVAEKNVDRIYQPLRQEISPQDVQEYGKHPELNEEIKIETRRGAALPDAFEVGSSPAEKVQKSQPQTVILQAVQEFIQEKDDVQEIQPELSRNKETGRLQQLVQQQVGSQNVQDYSKNPEFRVESQPYGKEIQATASMPELQDKIPFYVSKMITGERSEAIWIQLEPEHLGKVKIRVLLKDNKISVNLSVNRPETKGIIELQVPGIRRSLAQHEISVTEFRVSLENGFSNSNPRYSNLFHHNTNTNSRPAYERGDWNGNQSEHSNRHRYYRNDSLVDLFA